MMDWKREIKHNLDDKKEEIMQVMRWSEEKLKNSEGYKVKKVVDKDRLSKRASKTMLFAGVGSKLSSSLKDNTNAYIKEARFGAQEVTGGTIEAKDLSVVFVKEGVEKEVRAFAENKGLKGLSVRPVSGKVNRHLYYREEPRNFEVEDLKVPDYEAALASYIDEARKAGKYVLYVHMTRVHK